ncbi:MAG: hypothetical protein ACM31D_00915 [Bacteroidota bacterium]
MSLALFLHLLCIAAWTGCILVEALYEHSIDSSPTMRRFVSELHWRTDKYIEIPAFLGVLLSGGAMLHTAPMTPLLWTKVALGLVAIASNAACVWLVVKRLGTARAGDYAAWERLDHLQHKLGAVVLLTLVAALGIGGYALVGR